MKKILLSLALGFFCVMQLEAQDFKIENFRENLTDLTAKRAGVKDNNQKDAALLRFAVRDNKFEIEANMGVIRQENLTGELLLYVPEGTKRLTIRHPQLGLLRDYTIPIAIESDVTYDAEIVITNAEYLAALFAGGQPVGAPVKEEETKQDQPVVDEPVAVTPVVEEPKVEEPKTEEPPVAQQPAEEDPSSKVMTLDELLGKKPKSASDKLKVFAGVGFNALSTMGPSIHLGLGYKILSLEGGYVLGIDKVENVGFSVKGQSSVSETYDYSSSKLWVRLGVNANGNSRFQVTPQIGVSYNMISGKSKGSSSTSYFKTANSTSMFAALRFSYAVSRSMVVHVTPQYDFALTKGDVFSFIKTSDSKLKAWGEGIGVNAGVLFQF